MNPIIFHIIIIIIIIITANKDFSDLSLPFVFISRSSRPHPVSVQRSCWWVLAGCPTHARPWEEVLRRTSLMSSTACLSRIIWMVFVMSGRWPYSCCLVGCYIQNLFNTVRIILVQLPLSFFSLHFFIVHVMHPYSSIDTTAAWKICVLFYLTSIWPIVYQ